jgi:putative SOS response-associated peptidase YedK
MDDPSAHVSRRCLIWVRSSVTWKGKGKMAPQIFQTRARALGASSKEICAAGVDRTWNSQSARGFSGLASAGNFNFKLTHNYNRFSLFTFIKYYQICPCATGNISN